MKIYCNTNWPESDRERLLEAVHSLGHEVDFARPSTKPSAAGVAFLDSAARVPDIYDVAFGQPSVSWILQSNRLRWIQISSAGYTRYDRDDLRTFLKNQEIAFTNASSILADPCAQHVLAMMMSATRQLHAFADAQRNREWSADRFRPALRVLDGDHVLIVGFGSIGARLAELLKPMNVKLVGIRSRPRGNEPIRMHPVEMLDELLVSADHIVNLLPASPSTAGLFDAERFAKMTPQTIFYNIGRGSTVDHDALHSALQGGRLAAAYLDVTSPEPLPAEHPLWTTPNCFITPHIGGAMQDAAARQTEHFVANLRRFVDRDALIDQVLT